MLEVQLCRLDPLILDPFFTAERQRLLINRDRLSKERSELFIELKIVISEHLIIEVLRALCGDDLYL